MSCLSEWRQNKFPSNHIKRFKNNKKKLNPAFFFFFYFKGMELVCESVYHFCSPSSRILHACYHSWNGPHPKHYSCTGILILNDLTYFTILCRYISSFCLKFNVFTRGKSQERHSSCIKFICNFHEKII